MDVFSEINRTGVTKKQYVLGRRKEKEGGVLKIGRYYALDASLGSNVFIDVLKPHVVLICGKRGYGKSYTIGVFIEEVAQLEKEIRKNLGVIVFDTLGIYWTTAKKNKEESKQLKKWNLSPKSISINLLVPKKYVCEYRNNNIEVNSFSIQVSDLSALHWCHLFDINPITPLGIIITKAVLSLKESKKNYSIEDLLNAIKKNNQYDSTIVSAAENMLNIAESWGIFSKHGTTVSHLIKRGIITVLDVSLLPSQSLKDIVASLIGQQIFKKRVRARKIHEQKKMGRTIEDEGMPMVWMAIDEAQLILPDDKKSLSKEVFIDEWMRQGRQPGLSLILATQRPSALHQEVLSHCDILICHRLTSQQDIDALSIIRPTYMHGSIGESIRKVGDERGVAFILDDTSEATHIIKIRPRLSWHGGAESVVIEK